MDDEQTDERNGEKRRMREMGAMHTSAKDGARLLDGLGKHTQRVVQRALRLVQDLLGGPTQHDGAGLTWKIHTAMSLTLVRFPGWIVYFLNSPNNNMLQQPYFM